MCWRHYPHPRPRASAPAGEQGQGLPMGDWRVDQHWADTCLFAD